MEDTISQDYYVYTYRYPKSMGGAIFYVGKGKGDRIDTHEYEARKGFQSKKCDVIREIWKAGQEVVKEKVAYFCKEEDAFLYEWGLVNMTTYSETLTNIGRGMGHPHRIDWEKKFQQYGGVCIKRQMKRKSSLIYHKVPNIYEFCETQIVNRNMIIDVLSGKIKCFRGYSMVVDCGCSHEVQTLEEIPVEARNAFCDYCGDPITRDWVDMQFKRHYCSSSHLVAHRAIIGTPGRRGYL